MKAFQDLTQRPQRAQRRNTESCELLVGRAGDLQHGEKGFLRNVHATHALHALFSFFLLLQEFSFAENTPAVTLGDHVLAYRRDGLARDDAAADGGLDRDLEHLARNQFSETRDEIKAARVRD